MGTKTISLTEEAYERLRAHRRDRDDSFSRVVMRARWDEAGITAGELLERWRDLPPFFSDDELNAMEAGQKTDLPPEDKWTAR